MEEACKPLFQTEKDLRTSPQAEGEQLGLWFRVMNELDNPLTFGQPAARCVKEIISHHIELLHLSDSNYEKAVYSSLRKDEPAHADDIINGKIHLSFLQMPF